MEKTTVLIVEDEAVVAEDLRGMLTRSGYTVADVAASGEEAIAIAHRARPELVLMDIHLSGMVDGVEAAKTIGAQCGSSVVYLTAYCDDDTLARAKATEPSAYLLKPIRERDLLATIEVALYTRQIAELRKREQELLHKFDSMGKAIIVVSSENRVTYMNALAEAVVGHSLDEMRGTSKKEITEIIEKATTSLTPDHSEAASRHISVTDEKGRITGEVIVYPLINQTTTVSAETTAHG
jgi:PAS domain S-box-containing protein